MRFGSISVAAILVLALQTSAMANMTRSEVQQAVVTAQNLAQKEGWSQAIEFLRQKRRGCGPDESGRSCRSLINYSMGYMLERQARTDPDRREAHLLDAVESYRKVLADNTNHGPTLHNLALIHQQLGDPAESLNLLRQAVDSDPSRRYMYTTAIGDIHYEQGQFDEALQAYQRAAKWNPQAEEPPLRIIDVYGNLSTGRLRQLSKLLATWKNDYPEASAQGYRLIIKAARAAGDVKRAENAYLSWVSLLARSRRLTVARLNALYSDWQDPAIEELLSYILKGPEQYASMRWWQRKFQRQHVLAEAALTVGYMDLKKNGPKACEFRWQEAIREIAPPLYNYFDNDLPLIRLELQTELAALYYQYPELDPNNNKFGKLIWGIFRSKGDAYQMNDLKAIQSHHTVLGFIYTREPKRESMDHRATNAVFQLYHAINTANRRFRNGQPYQPLPQLKEMLAHACRNPSRVAERRSSNLCTDRGRKKTGDLYLEAAQAYLDTDQLEKAANMLKSAQADRLSNSGMRIYDDLTQIVETRERIEEITSANADAVAASLVDRHTAGNWFTDDQVARLPRDFVSRQRFKTISDLALKLEDFKEINESTASSLKMIEPDLKAASKSLVLAGTADQLRVEKLAAIGIRPTSAEDCPGSTDREDVRWVQRSLNKIMETELEADGRYGSGTRTAVRAFQERYGLDADGKAGSQTKAKIRQLLCE